MFFFNLLFLSFLPFFSSFLPYNIFLFKMQALSIALATLKLFALLRLFRFQIRLYSFTSFLPSRCLFSMDTLSFISIYHLRLYWVRSKIASTMCVYYSYVKSCSIENPEKKKLKWSFSLTVRGLVFRWSAFIIADALVLVSSRNYFAAVWVNRKTFKEYLSNDCKIIFKYSFDLHSVGFLKKTKMKSVSKKRYNPRRLTEEAKKKLSDVCTNMNCPCNILHLLPFPRAFM